MAGLVPAGRVYRPDIDALRAIAVIAVVHHHFWANSILGQLGVRLFFVISAYLITGILLDGKASISAGRDTLRGALTSFYIKRVLRIFPVYYAFLLIAALLNVQNINATIWWHVSYLSNFLFAIRNDWGPPWVSGHLWSLSIEEQYYLLWPCLVLLQPSRVLAWTCAAMIVAAIGFRWIWSTSGLPEVGIFTLPPAAFDAFGAGALLAVAHRNGMKLSWLPMAGAAGTAAYFAAGWVGLPHLSLWRLNAPPILTLLPLVALVALAAQGFTGWTASLSRLPAVLYIGKISYGIYLYHMFCYVTVDYLCRRVGIEWSMQRGPLLFAVLFVITVLIASLSWKFIESPLLKLKPR